MSEQARQGPAEDSAWIARETRAHCAKAATGEHWWLRQLDGGRKCYLCGQVEAGGLFREAWDAAERRAAREGES